MRPLIGEQAGEQVYSAFGFVTLGVLPLKEMFELMLTGGGSSKSY